MRKLIIEILPHAFHVYVPYENNRAAVFSFCKSLTEYVMDWSPKHRCRIQKPKKTYAVASADRSTFGFLLGELDNFLSHVKIYGIRDNDIEIKRTKAPDGQAVSFDLPGITPRENQFTALEFLAKRDPIRVLPLPTGQGKTLTTLLALAALGQRFCIFAQAGHLPTWLKTIVDKTTIKKDEILVIRGSSPLKALMALGYQKRLKAKAILISSSTFNNYLKEYVYGGIEGDSSYEFTPEKFFELIDCEVAITDECHEVLHQVVRRAIMTVVKQHIYLSATLDSSSPIINRIYETIYPHSERFKDFKNNDHIVVRPTYYSFHNHSKIRYIGPQGYNHGLLEEGIMKNPKFLDGYLSVIKETLDFDYFKNRKPGTKLLVFAARIEMCVIIRDFIETIMPEGCTVSKFTFEDPESVLEDFEIIVSTPKSCGTGRDIPNLMVSVMTPAVASKQLSQQILGRTRPSVLYPNEDPRFYYLVCRDIQKHVDYDIGHIKDFSDKSRSIEPLTLTQYV